MTYMAMGLKPNMTMDDFDVYARIKCSLVNGTERAIIDDNWDDIERYIRRNSETNDISEAVIRYVHPVWEAYHSD